MKKQTKYSILKVVVVLAVCAIAIFRFWDTIKEYARVEIDITTPALLFPAVSLIILAYTSRFLELADLVRRLHARYQENPGLFLLGQIQNLQKRIILIRDMQAAAATCMFLCIICIFFIFAGLNFVAVILFGISLFMLLVSLGYSIWEIYISVNALKLQLFDVEMDAKKREEEK